jgi:hypothetical protein
MSIAIIAIIFTYFSLMSFPIDLCSLLYLLRSKATASPLPEDIDKFIVNIVEPNFTPGLLVLLGFSVSLGAFATMQMASAGSTYKEEN